MGRCWECANSILYPVVEERGRIFCSHTCHHEWKDKHASPVQSSSTEPQPATEAVLSVGIHVEVGEGRDGLDPGE